MPLTLWGNPILDSPSMTMVAADFGPDLAELSARMMLVMYAAQGAGLAAPQVNIAKRFFVYNCDGVKGMIANPVIVSRSRQLQDDDEEGCLSVPGFRWPTPRAYAVTVDGLDAYGNSQSVDAEGYLARCVQHEIDHLDGRVYLTRLGGKTGRTALRAARSAPWYGQQDRMIAI